MPTEDDILNTKQAADLLGVKPHYVRTLCQDDRLECFKLGRDWLIMRASLEEYQRTRRPPGRPPKSSKEEE